MDSGTVPGYQGTRTVYTVLRKIFRLIFLHLCMCMDFSPSVVSYEARPLAGGVRVYFFGVLSLLDFAKIGPKKNRMVLNYILQESPYLVQYSTLLLERLPLEWSPSYQQQLCGVWRPDVCVLCKYLRVP